MEIIKGEKKINNFPEPVSINGTMKILEQMKNSICKIYKANGTGFFCHIPYKNTYLNVLMTNYHVIDENFIKENDVIKLTLNDDNEDKNISLDEDRKVYLNKDYDITIIEIKDKDKLNKSYYLELDDNLTKEKSELFYECYSIYIIQYPNFDKAFVSYGLIKQFDSYNINHLCTTEKGSSGSPILNLKNNKVIGIHKDSSERFNFNIGTFLKYPMNQLNNNNNEIKLIKEIKNNFNYFLKKNNNKQGFNNNINQRYLFNNYNNNVHSSKKINEYRRIINKSFNKDKNSFNEIKLYNKNNIKLESNNKNNFSNSKNYTITIKENNNIYKKEPFNSFIKPLSF